jgi:putative DNA primase/helicase
VAQDFAAFAERLKVLLATVVPVPQCAADDLGARKSAMAEAKKSLPAFGPHLLEGSRAKDNVRAITLLVWDLDGVPCEAWTSALAKLQSEGGAFAAYGSPSDDASAATRKVRLVLPLTGALDPDEADRLREAIGLYLGIEHDEKARDASRIFFVGRLEGTPDRESWHRDGTPINPPDWAVEIAALLSARRSKASTYAKKLGAVQPGGKYAGIKPPRRNRSAPMCPAGVAPEAHAVAVCKWAPPAIQGSAGHNALLLLATDLVIGLLLASEDAAEIAAEHYNPRCEPPWDLGSDGDSADFERKFAEAVANKLGRALGYLLAPDGGPAPNGNAQDELRADTGNAKRLVRLYGESLRYFTAWHRWFAWDGRRWCRDERGHIEQYAKSAAETLWDEAKREPDDEKRKAAFKWALDCQNRGRIESMIALARSEPGIPVVADELDRDPFKFNVQNGTIDLRTGELLPHDRADLITNLAPVDFVKGARSELWLRSLSAWTNNDDVLAAYIQRAIGYALLGEWREKAFWFAYGEPDGGKSTFLNAVAAVFGTYFEGADASTWLVQTNTGGNRGDLTRLLGKRFVVSVEFKRGAHFDVAVMKRTTGGDPITAAAKYKDDITFRPTLALWLAANDRPIASDDDEGFMSRMRCVPFTHVIQKSQQNAGLGRELRKPEHMTGILAWAVEGCLAYQLQGLGTCKAVDAASSAYRAAMNPAADFLAECVERVPGGWVPAPEMARRYSQWCAANDVRRPLASKQLGKRLRDFGATGGDDGSRNHGVRIWSGVTLKPDDAASPDAAQPSQLRGRPRPPSQQSQQIVISPKVSLETLSRGVL